MNGDGRIPDEEAGMTHPDAREIRVPGTRRPDFAEECHRPCHQVAQTDMADTSMQQFMEEIPAGVEN